MNTALDITLKAARINAGLDQADVADAIGVNIATVSSWETGRTRPSLDNLEKLCQLYNWPQEHIRWEVPQE